MVVTRIFELHIVRDICERMLYIGDNEHTILFKYEICEIDQHGTVIRSVSFSINFTLGEKSQRHKFILFRQETKKIRCKWSPVEDKVSDSLPLTEFQNTSDKT